MSQIAIDEWQIECVVLGRFDRFAFLGHDHCLYCPHRKKEQQHDRYQQGILPSVKPKSNVRVRTFPEAHDRSFLSKWFMRNTAIPQMKAGRDTALNRLESLEERRQLRPRVPVVVSGLHGSLVPRSLRDVCQLTESLLQRMTPSLRPKECEVEVR